MEGVAHVFPESSRAEFVACGFRPSFFFPHRIHRLPKCGPDGAKLASRMCGVTDLERLWQIVLYAERPALDEFPDEIFYDPDLVWHQQHFGRTGQVASVDLAVKRGILYSMAHQSDLVQRISRRRALKTRVEKVFVGWHHLLLNAIAGFARDNGIATIRLPTSRLALRNTDQARVVKPELFERVYDRAVRHHWQATERDEWWDVTVASLNDRIVEGQRQPWPIAPGKTIAICHDIERGLGFRGIDAAFAERADAESPAALEGMLAVERRVGIRATYNVVGCIMNEVRTLIERDGHPVAFHSWDHDLGRDQLGACRQVDYRIKGYRVPQSKLTSELSNERLAWHNFEWMASSSSSFRVERPRLDRRLVKIPVTFDDFGLHTGALAYDGWRRKLLDLIRAHDFVALSLHDCFSGHWLPHYESLLRELAAVVPPRTLDEVAADLYLAAGV